MQKREIARAIARRTGVSRAEAADQVDRLVHGILKKLRSGQSAKLPGFGHFKLDADGHVDFQRDTHEG